MRRAPHLIALVGVIAVAVVVATALRGTADGVGSATTARDTVGSAAAKRSCPPDDRCTHGRPYERQTPPSDALERACRHKPARKCWTRSRLAKLPKLRAYYRHHTRSKPPRGALTAAVKRDTPLYYACHQVSQPPSPPATTCSHFSIGRSWYGMTYSISFDQYETRKIAKANSFNAYVELVTTGQPLLAAVGRSIPKAGLIGLAVLGFIAAIWELLRVKAQDAVDDGQCLRLTLHTVWFPVPVKWWSSSQVNGA